MNRKTLALGVGGVIGGLVALKFLRRPNEVVWDDVAEFVHHHEHSHFVEVDGATIHFQEFGSRQNPTVLLIHGYTASTYVWADSTPLLAENGFHVIAVDLLGFGFSDKPRWFDYAIASQARIIERFMDRLGIGRAMIVGSSYGGAVALTIALDYAERVEKLVLVDAVINDEVKNMPILKIARVRGLGEIISPFFLDSKMLMRRRMRGTLDKSKYHLITNDRIASVLRPLSAADGHHAVLQTNRNWDANRIEADAYLVTQPTLIIWGENDAVISIRNGEKLYDSILNSRFVVLKDCGHVPQEETPEVFSALVAQFCKNSHGRLVFAENDEISYSR